jgi:hypothetical protein
MGTWSDWQAVGGAIISAPSVASRTAERLTVVAPGTTNNTARDDKGFPSALGSGNGCSMLNRRRSWRASARWFRRCVAEMVRGPGGTGAVAFASDPAATSWPARPAGTAVAGRSRRGRVRLEVLRRLPGRDCLLLRLPRRCKRRGGTRAAQVRVRGEGIPGGRGGTGRGLRRPGWLGRRCGRCRRSRPRKPPARWLAPVRQGISSIRSRLRRYVGRYGCFGSTGNP